MEASMRRIWVLAADASRARLFETNGGKTPFSEIQDFSNPAGRAHDRDLVTDAQGRYRSKAPAAPPRIDPSEHEAERFAKKLGDYLDHERTQNRFDRLYLIGGPHFLGLLRKELGKDTHSLVADEIVTDCTRSSPSEIEALLREKTQRALL
jgi:protein required for attachment to host cells